MAETVDVGGDGPVAAAGGLTGSVEGDDYAFHGTKCEMERRYENTSTRRSLRLECFCGGGGFDELRPAQFKY